MKFIFLFFLLLNISVKGQFAGTPSMIFRSPIGLTIIENLSTKLNASDIIKDTLQFRLRVITSGTMVKTNFGYLVSNMRNQDLSNMNPTVIKFQNIQADDTVIIDTTIIKKNVILPYYLRSFLTAGEKTYYGDDIEIMPYKPNDITSLTGKVWMSASLGAKRIANSITDNQAYGYQYQWGRPSDGHQLPGSLTTSTRETNNFYTSDKFIAISTTTYTEDWLATSNNSLWQGVDGKNNPCPIGYRVPTRTEWEAEVNKYAFTTNSDNTNNPFQIFKFAAAGYRDHRGVFTTYNNVAIWLSTITVGQTKTAQRWGVDNNNNNFNDVGRTVGFQVRCIKD